MSPFCVYALFFSSRAQNTRNMLAFTLTLIVLLVTVVCYYIKRIYFTLTGSIPGLSPQFLVGNLLQTGILGQNVPMNVVFLKLKAQFGDIFQFWLGSTRIIVVSSLEDIQHIFSHRQIYDQGAIFVDKISLVNPNAMLCMRGKIESKPWRPCNIICFINTYRRSEVQTTRQYCQCLVPRQQSKRTLGNHLRLYGQAVEPMANLQ